MRFLREMSVLLLVVASLGLTSCDSTTTNDGLYHGWYSVYGEECGYNIQPGCNYFSSGSKAMVYSDPFYFMYTWEQDSFSGLWFSPSGIIYTTGGFAINATEPQMGRDLIAAISENEEAMIQKAGLRLAERFSLEDKVAVKVARTLNDWALLGFSRERTAADLADFTQRLYGIDFNRVGSALTKAALGDESEISTLVNEAAVNWKTTPENMREILDTFHADL